MANEDRLRWLRTFRGYTEDEAALAAWAADMIECLRDRVNELELAIMGCIGFDEKYGWFGFSDEHGDNLREFLIPVMEKVRLPGGTSCSGPSSGSS